MTFLPFWFRNHVFFFSPPDSRCVRRNIFFVVELCSKIFLSDNLRIWYRWMKFWQLILTFFSLCAQHKSKPFSHYFRECKSTSTSEFFLKLKMVQAARSVQDNTNPRIHSAELSRWDWLSSSGGAESSWVRSISVYNKQTITNPANRHHLILLIKFLSNEFFTKLRYVKITKFQLRRRCFVWRIGSQGEKWRRRLVKEPNMRNSPNYHFCGWKVIFSTPFRDFSTVF